MFIFSRCERCDTRGDLMRREARGRAGQNNRCLKCQQQPPAAARGIARCSARPFYLLFSSIHGRAARVSPRSAMLRDAPLGRVRDKRRNIILRTMPYIGMARLNFSVFFLRLCRDRLFRSSRPSMVPALRARAPSAKAWRETRHELFRGKIRAVILKGLGIPSMQVSDSSLQIHQLQSEKKSV